MSLLSILGHVKPAPGVCPAFVREMEDIRGVRVVRLQGPVGKEIGGQARIVDEAAAKAEGVFTRPLLFDFADTTGWDFSTVSYMVLALRRRMAAKAPVGLINAPPQLLDELQLARVEGLFHIFATEEEAVAELIKPRQ
jgi:hypothetical protein